MSQEHTKLNEKQFKAINLILEGNGDAEIAEEIGVTRETVNRWKNQDDSFVVILNATRRMLWNSHYEHLRSLVGPALDVIETEITEKNTSRAAFELLKVVGIYGSVSFPSGPETEEDLQDIRKQARKDQLFQEKLKSIADGLM